MTGMEQELKNTPLTYGMIGGGVGSFIGNVHRMSLGLTGNAKLVCGCFGTKEENNLKIGDSNGVSQERIYKGYFEMADAESKRQDRIDFIVIVTPNNLHYAIAKHFLSKGFNVVCEKPLCFEVEEAEELKSIAEERGLMFCVTYTYIGYPMVKQARKLIQQGKIGDITFVMAEYAQEWVAERSAMNNGNLPVWRNDPKYTGKSSCIGDIGTHVECTVSYITGLKIRSVCANLRSVGQGVRLDSNGEVLVKYDNGVSGIYWCSQVAIGNANAFKIRIFGSKGSIEWEQENPCKLKVAILGEPVQILTQGKKYLDGAALEYCRLPSGHPEGFIEAFANNYTAFTRALIKRKAGAELSADDLDFAGIDEGLNGVKFVGSCVKSSQNNCSWVNF